MEDGRCKLGLLGRLELVRLIEQGSTLRQAAACLSVAPATAHRWWHRWQAASVQDRASRACLRTRSSRPRSCPWALSSEDEQAILTARERTELRSDAAAVFDRPASLDDLEGPQAPRREPAAPQRATADHTTL